MANQLEVLKYLYNRKDEWVPLDEMKKELGERVGTKLSKLMRFNRVTKKYVNELLPVKRPSTRGYRATITKVYYKFKKFG